MPTLDWIGKQAVIGHHETVPFRLLKRDPELSVGDAESGNLLVQGDNLEALKALLPRYAGQVKLIYIDPPYNTGNEGWVYNDNVNSPEMKAWLEKIVGGESEDLSRHDKWLCMMYPRLKLLHELLAPDGSLWMSLDDNEVHHARAILDEVFGTNNFVTTIIWQKVYAPKSSARHFSEDHDYIIVYAKNASNWNRNMIPRTEAANARYKNADNDSRGEWKAGDLSARNYYTDGSYEVTSPTGKVFSPPAGRYWAQSQKRFLELDSDDRIWWGKDGNNMPSMKRFLTDVQQGMVPQTLWTYDSVGHTQEGKKEIREILPTGTDFMTPKPTRLLERILQIATSPSSNDIVLDSFAGSGTTGHAVLKQNAADGGNRQFVLVEMLTEVAEPITKKRLEYAVAQHGGGFAYARLGETLFEAGGRIRDGVSYAALAQHVYYSETAETLLEVKDGALLGISNAGVAVYLLYNGVLKDKHALGGNVLTRDVLRDLPVHDGPRVIYGTANRLSADTMTRLNLTFKQIPYQIRVR